MEATELQPVSSRHDVSRRNSLEAPASISQDFSESQLPPIDRGKDAWLFLITCFFIEALVWGMHMDIRLLVGEIRAHHISGFAFSFGVFQDYYSTHEPFAGSGNIAIIGTTATVSSPLHRQSTSLLIAYGRVSFTYPLR